MLIATALGAVTLALLCWGACQARTIKVKDACNDPARERLEKLWRLQQSGPHDSLFGLSSMVGVETTLAEVDQTFVDVRRSNLKSSTCPYGQGSPEEVLAYQKSLGGIHRLCPTHDVINYDENRIPSTLFEKRCSCSSCGIPLGRSPATGSRRKGARAFPEASGSLRGEGVRHHRGSHTQHPDHMLGCRPVIYPTRVLRRVGCKRNMFVYQTVLEPLVVGCACDELSTSIPEEEGRRVRAYTES